MKAIVIMNHKLNNDQIEDLKTNWNIDRIDYLNDEEQKRWEIPPELDTEELQTHLQPIINRASQYDFIIIAGELSACLTIINILRNIRCLTATTKRQSVETISGNEVIKKSIFKHVRFREL